MSKRFTDTNKYKDPFIRGLKGPYKLLWDYLYHDCDHAGIWIVDFDVAQLYLGPDMLVNKEDALRYFNDEKERVVILDGGKKWFIKKFVDFQYGELDERNRVHLSVINELKKNGYEIKVLVSPLQGRKDKDKDKDKDSLGEESPREEAEKPPKPKTEKTTYAPNVLLTEKEYEDLVEKHTSEGVEWMIQKLSAYKDANGKTYKSDAGAIRSWVVGEWQKTKSETGSFRKEKVPASDEWEYINRYLA